MMKIQYFIYLAILPAMISCGKKAETVKAKPPVIVDVIVAKPVSLSTVIEVNGSALSEEMIELHPETSGRLTYLNIPDGANVSAGTVLARINDAELQAQMEQQKASLELATKTEQRLRKLLEVNGVNQSDYDIALNQVNTLSAAIKITEALIDKTVVKAAFDGTLGLRLVSPGAYVTPQTILGTLQQTDKIKIDFTVPETYSGLIAVGNKIFIQSNGEKEKQSAVISAIEPQINIDTRNLKVRARPENGQVKPGAFVKVLLYQDKSGIIVPSNAIIPEANSNQIVMIKNKKAKFVNVETGLRYADDVELVSGVNQGDTIVVSGILFVRPNSVLTVRKIIPQSTGNSLESKQIAQ
jgi:membrane fusion protein (multidrug efflux system)